MDKPIEDYVWSPNAECEVLFKTLPHELEHWPDIIGRTISWEERFDEEGEPFGNLYVFGHEPIYDSIVELLPAPDSNLLINWNAKCDVNWKEGYNANLELSISTNLRFKGIWFGRKPESECREILTNHFPVEEFTFNKTEAGVSLFTPVR